MCGRAEAAAGRGKAAMMHTSGQQQTKAKQQWWRCGREGAAAGRGKAAMMHTSRQLQARATQQGGQAVCQLVGVRELLQHSLMRMPTAAGSQYGKAKQQCGQM